MKTLADHFNFNDVCIEQCPNATDREACQESVSCKPMYVIGFNKAIEINQEKLEKAKEALEFYADDSNWAEGYQDSGEYIQIHRSDMEKDYFTKTNHCGGKIARITLKEIE